MTSLPIELHVELENLLVFRVDQDLHHVDLLMAPGIPHARARMALKEHQARQPKQAIYIWKDEINFPGIQRMAEHRNGTDPSERIHARACAVEAVGILEARAFYDIWHLQGSCAQMPYSLGLRHKGILVALMSFRDPKACRGLAVPWMLQRFTSTGRVTGAASRLLAAWRREHPGAVVSYSDNRYSPTGGLYGTLGFTLKFEAQPDYRYWRGGRWYAKNTKQRKHLIAELGGCGPQDTEYTMAARAGYRRCYDCGKKTWVLE